MQLFNLYLIGQKPRHFCLLNNSRVFFFLCIHYTSASFFYAKVYMCIFQHLCSHQLFHLGLATKVIPQQAQILVTISDVDRLLIASSCEIHEHLFFTNVNMI